MTRTALITGATGQDGAYLSRLLLEKDYEVYAGTRGTSTANTWRLRDFGIEGEVEVVPLDLVEETKIQKLLEEIEPDELYNLAAQSSVGRSFDSPIYTAKVNALGTLRLLEAIRVADFDTRFFQASSSEMFGQPEESPQTEETPFHPTNPYGISKIFGHWCTVNYRETYGMHASSGILFNHESPLRSSKFVTRKISIAFAKIAEGQQDVLELGNLDAERDWGYAGDFVEAMWEMLQRPEGGTFVLSTGERRSVRDFTGAVAGYHGLDLRWEGEGVDEEGFDRKTGERMVKVNPEFFRPSEGGSIEGEAKNARDQLQWSPKTGFEDLAHLMAEADLDRVRRGNDVS